MLGIRFIKSQPTTYLMEFKNGKVRRAAAGLSLFYYAPSTTLVAVPIGTQINDFIFNFKTADFQSVSMQGQVTWRIEHPQRAAAMLNFALTANGAAYASEDPQKLAQLVLKPIEVLAQNAVQRLELHAALHAGDAIAQKLRAELSAHPEIEALGLQILGLAVAAVRPSTETARALEAKTREEILKSADDAIYARRNAAVEQERTIRQSELDTEVAVELKKRQVRETQMDAQASIQRKEAELKAAQMQTDVELEKQRSDFVAVNAQNTRLMAEAQAHRVGAVMQALEKADSRIVQALAAAGMNPGQLIAQAFGGIAERAERIGQLNMSPDLLDRLLAATEGGTRNPS